jgi:hypothetical protein
MRVKCETIPLTLTLSLQGRENFIYFLSLDGRGVR